MANNFRTIYLYIVSLITLGMVVGGIISTVNNITSYFYPDSYAFFEQESGNTYIDDDDYEYDYDNDTTENNQVKRENYRNGKIKNTVVSIAVAAVGGIMYKYHWKIIEKERVK